MTNSNTIRSYMIPYLAKSTQEGSVGVVSAEDLGEVW